VTRNWEQVLISRNSSLKSALEIINKEALRVALVVSETRELEGLVTDGDIRRALLQGKGLDTIVNEVMTTTPLTAQIGTDRTALLRMMKDNDLLFIPLLDGRRIAGLETLNDALVSKEKRENPVFLMAGGFGTRLKPLTDKEPKPLLKIGARPILEILIRRFSEAGFHNIFISTHYLSSKIVDYFGDGSSLGVNITYLEEEVPLGTGGALGLLSDYLINDLPIIMMNGDVLTKAEFGTLLDFHVKNKVSATVCVREYNYEIPYGVVNGDGRKITSMVEKPIHRYFVNAGVYVLSPAIARSLIKNTPIDMPTILEQQRLATDDVIMFPLHEYWLDIGSLQDFQRAQRDVIGLDLS